MSIAQKAYDLIRGEILTCSLAPGQQIVQARLVEKFGLGMTPIREALLRLAHEGLVQPYPRFGYIVSPVTEEMVRHLYEVRMILETAAVRLAVERASDAQLRQVAESARFTYVYKNHEQYVRFLERNAAFHDSIAMLAGNPRLADLLRGLFDELSRIFHLGLDLRDSAEEMQSEHTDLAEALLARDADRAGQVVRAQIGRSQQRVLEALHRGQEPVNVH
jgi:DNA-binding GntR family transcriptional regulator